MLALLALHTALCALLAVPSTVVATTSVMMFDAPGSQDSPLTVALALGALAAPVILVASPLAAWAAFAASHYRTSRWAMLAPLGWLAYMAVVALLVETVCGGSFVC